MSAVDVPLIFYCRPLEIYFHGKHESGLSRAGFEISLSLFFKLLQNYLQTRFVR